MQVAKKEIGANARHLDVLEPTSGLRAVACLGVLIGHCMFWVVGSSADKLQVYVHLDRHPWMTGLIKMTEVFMDTFLVLTGFLAAQSLMTAMPLASTYSSCIHRYYTRRFMRIAPSLYSMLTLVRIAVLPAITSGRISPDARLQRLNRRAFVDVDPFNLDNCPRRLWASFAFMNNYLPYAGCASHTWSVAVQMQFYALAPLALLLMRPRAPFFRQRVARACVACIAAALAHRLHTMVRVRLWTMVPAPFYGPFTGDMQARLHHLWSASYLSLAPHLPALCLGVLAQLALSSPAFMAGFARHQDKVAVAAAALLALIIADCRNNSYGPAPDPKHPGANPATLAVGFVLVTGLLQPLVPCLALLLACAKLPGPSALLARILSWGWCRWVADLSYDVYLLHPIVILAVWSVLPPSEWFDPRYAAPFVRVTCLVVALSFGAAYLHSRLVGAAVRMLSHCFCKLGRERPTKER